MQNEQTFLFADLVGYTALADIEGDDRAADVALKLQREIDLLVRGYGGETVKALGDGVMLRCPDAAGGVRLGLRIVGEFASDRTFPPVRVGVHTGTAVGRNGDWFGRTVNVAARLCAAAAGDEVLVSASTREAAGRMAKVEFGEHKLHWLRNVTEPIVTYSARQRRPPATRLRAAAARALPQCPRTAVRLEAA
jgi:adenylate cyclase